MLWFFKNLPLRWQFFLEILRGAPDVVLIWFWLDVISASFSVTRTLQSWEAALTIRATKSSSPFVTCHSRAMDNKSLGCSPLWNSICDAVTALLIFSGFHSYKLITGPSHVPVTIHMGVFRFSFSFYCLCQSISLFSQLELPEGKAHDKLLKWQWGHSHCSKTIPSTELLSMEPKERFSLAWDWWKINLPSFCCFCASTR